jgi:hypothetical protein
MRYAVTALGLLLAACGTHPGKLMDESRDQYKACLDARPPAECESARLKFEADKAAADVYARGDAARRSPIGPVVVNAPQPIDAPRRSLNCTTYGPNTTCY